MEQDEEGVGIVLVANPWPQAVLEGQLGLQNVSESARFRPPPSVCCGNVARRPRRGH